MKKKIKCFIAYLLVLEILICELGVGVTHVQAQEKEDEDSATMEISTNSVAEKEDAEIEVSYKLTSKWENHYNVDVTLGNMTDGVIDNWEICIPANYEIENIWNATITDYLDGEYTIHNAEWNQDIPVDGTVSFGMTVKCSDEIQIPKYVDTIGLREQVNEDRYEIEFKKHNQWDDKMNAQIIITNKSDKKIEDWSMLLDANFKIEQIWNATIEDDIYEEDLIYHRIKNSGNNQNIYPNQSVEFSFIATCKSVPEISRSELHQMTSDFEFSDDSEDDDERLEFVDEFILDSDYFETREEYEAYLEEKGLTDDSLMDIEEPVTAAYTRKKAVASTKPVAECTGIKIGLGETERATQHYIPFTNGNNYLMSAIKNDALVVKQTMDANGNSSCSEAVRLERFGHGQTFEQFFIPKQGEHFLLAGGTIKKFAKKLAIIPRSFFDKRVSNKEKVNFKEWKTGNGLFRIMTDLEYANKNGTKRGDLYRVDAALSASGSTLVIWKEVQNGGKIWEISLYEMDKILDIYSKQRKAEQRRAGKGKLKEKDKNKSLKLSFKDMKEPLMKACIGSFWEKKTTSKASVLKPNDSFQSIDVEEYSENMKAKWRLALTSGNEIGNMKLATITRFEVEKREEEEEKVKGEEEKVKREEGVTYKAYRNHIVMQGYPGAKLELEGGHIMGKSQYNFIAMRKSGQKTNKSALRTQYFANIDLFQIENLVKE